MRCSRHLGRAGRPGGSALAVALAVGLAASACSSIEGTFSSSPPSSPPPASSSGGSSFSQRMNALFFGSPASPGEPKAAAGPNPDVDCPSVDVRSGASTLSVAAPGVEANATNLRYQASIAQTARECAVL